MQLEKNDYRTLMENLLVLPSLYNSRSRRAYISNLTLMFSENNVTLEEIRKGLKYFKKLQLETTENKAVLEEVIRILKKYSEQIKYFC